MITGIVIPHDTELPLAEEPFGSLADYQKAVGGYVEIVHISSPRLSMYANEEGKVYGLPINRRATCLWWLVSPESRGRDVLVGDIVLIGASRGPNSATDLDQRFRALLLETASYKLEVRLMSDRESWRPTEGEYRTYFDAAIRGINLLESSMSISDIRVIAA
jgi:hypothetical protein